MKLVFRKISGRCSQVEQIYILIQEMMTAASALLPKYLAPLQQQLLTKFDKIKLYQRIQPDLVTTMTELSSVPSFKTPLDLPYNLKMLLVSAFLASHNPARLDKRFFCKGKSSRRKVKSRKGSKLSDALKGPKTFPLDRLLAIHSSVTQVSRLLKIPWRINMHRSICILSYKSAPWSSSLTHK